MTKLLSISTLAILAILLIAIGFFSFRDKQPPTPIVNDPAYVAAIAPPISMPPLSQWLSKSPDSDQEAGSTTGPKTATTEPEPTVSDSPDRTTEATAPEAITSDPATMEAAISAADQATNADDPEPKTVQQDQAADTGDLKPKASGQPPRTYTVRKGDSLALIARRLYGDPNLWSAIAAANPSVNPSSLRIDQVLQLPAETALSAEQPPRGQTEGGPVKHQIQPGDSLSSIAGSYYGDPTQWRRIRDANREVLGKDLKQLRVGRTLTIPQ